MGAALFPIFQKKINNLYLIVFERLFITDLRLELALAMIVTTHKPSENVLQQGKNLPRSKRLPGVPHCCVNPPTGSYTIGPHHRVVNHV